MAMHCFIGFFISLYLLTASASSQKTMKAYLDVKPGFGRSNPQESAIITPVRVRGDYTVMEDAKLFRDRDSSNQVASENDDTDFAEPMYRVNAFDKDILLKLEKYDSHMAPAYTTTYTWKNASNSMMSNRHGLIGCFYKGTVVGVPDSMVGVSLCNGMTGTIRSEGYEYTISPMGSSDSDASNHHTIHRRSIASSQSTPCAVNDKRHKRSYRSTFMRHVEALGKQLKSRRNRRSLSSNDGISVVNANEMSEEIHSREKRNFYSRQHYVETMVVADRSMAEHHGNDLEHYILTVSMVANQVFAHSSLGNAVSLSIVKIMVIDNEHAGPRIDRNAGVTLHNFCTWQRKYNTPDDTDPNHYDLAVLLTRKDLCGDTCDTLGMAEVGSMCSTRHSCAVVEEDGLSTAYTIAHEVGHVLNMMHDDNALCRSNFAQMNPDSHIMSSTMNQIDSDQPWSQCSRKAITDFLESGRGECLYDQPQKPKVFPTQLPGEMYDINAQCEMAFGPGSSECSFMPECGRLWCHTPGQRNQCHTRHFPRADGSPCGRGLHCFQGKCTRADEVRDPQDGKWGKWGEFGSCSRTCGGGVQMSSRECNNPAPKHGGKFCTGTRLRFRSCNTNKCPLKQGSDGQKYKPDYRAEQCAVYNGKSFPNLGIYRPATWLPKYTDVHPDDKCKLTCQSAQTGSYVTVSEKVVDGTKCGPDTTDVCVQGHCMKAGCDGVLGSSATYDKCGRCNGGNINCKRVRGSYNKKIQGYKDVITLPAGAASIDILQRAYRNKVHDGNYLALKNSKGRYLLNGGLTLSTIKKDIDLNGTLVRYTGVGNSNERIVASMPISEPLTVQVLSLGLGNTEKLNPPRIKYTYYIVQTKGGRRNKGAKTVLVNRSFNNVLKKPSENPIQAGTKPSYDPKSKSEPLPPDASSQLRWVTGRWTKCRPSTVGCSGRKTRKVICKDSKGKPATGCQSLVRPYQSLPCIVTSCSVAKSSRSRAGKVTGGRKKNRGREPTLVSRIHEVEREQGIWVPGQWSVCDKQCGWGKKRRFVTCRSIDRRLLGNSNCDGKPKPSSESKCMLRAC